MVGRDRSAAYTVELGVQELTDEINELRIALDFKQRGMSFDLGVAHTLYEKLLSPAEPYLKGIKHLFVVPSGPLERIPLGNASQG